MNIIRTEILQFDDIECKIQIFENQKACLIYSKIKHPNWHFFQGKKIFLEIGGAECSKFSNTYEMVLYFMNYDDSNNKYYI